MRAINRFLLDHDLRLRTNPCVSPDFCLDWPGFLAGVRADRPFTLYRQSQFTTAAGDWLLIENDGGDHAWQLSPRQGAAEPGLEDGAKIGGRWLFPATFSNLLALKNLIQESDPESTIFPNAAGRLGQSTLGLGARFTTLHWPATEWAMAQLGVGLTANQNSIPRELVYDVDQMLAGRLDTVAFPFIGANVPEGHQGQSVEGMSHGCGALQAEDGISPPPHPVELQRRPPADRRQVRRARGPPGRRIDPRQLHHLRPVARTGPEPAGALGKRSTPPLVARVRDRLRAAGLAPDEARFPALLCQVWPALQKMHRRDRKYREARARAFTTEAGRRYLRELSIDELPGLTEPETTAVMLALCEALDMPVNFIAPAFGFQKNCPYPDNAALRGLIERQWRVCREFGVSIGFHSGSGKSAENYEVMGEVTGGRLEIKTSGRYTYEMGVALHAVARSGRPGACGATGTASRSSWRRSAAFSADPPSSGWPAASSATRSARPGPPRRRMSSPRPPPAARPSRRFRRVPDHMFFFEYNFLFVLAAGGRAEKAALGDHSPAGYAQRARFYGISPEGRLRYAQRTAAYILFLAEHTGLAPRRALRRGDRPPRRATGAWRTCSPTSHRATV